MASTAISVVTSLLSGVAPNVGTIAASGDTCTITGPSGGPLDLNSLVIRIDSTTTAVSNKTVISATDAYSGLSMGSYEVTIPTGTTVYIGGEGFESARFLQSTAQSIVLTFDGAASCAAAIEAVQAPYSHAG